MTTYPLEIPKEIGFSNIRFRAVNATSLSTSPFTFSQQVFKHQGERWELDIQLPPMKKDKAEPWITFLLSLRGHLGTFLVGDPLANCAGTDLANPDLLATNRSVLINTESGDSILIVAQSSTASVAVGNQTGYTVDINGADPNVVLKAGDYLQIGIRGDTTLHKILSDVTTDFNGEATLDIWPRLRGKHSAGTTVTWDCPKGLFRLKTPITEWDINNIDSYGINFTAVEVIV